MVIIDTAPLTLAIETVGGVMAPIIPRNTAIPVKRSQARSKILYLKILNFSTLAVNSYFFYKTDSKLSCGLLTLILVFNFRCNH